MGFEYSLYFHQSVKGSELFGNRRYTTQETIKGNCPRFFWSYYCIVDFSLPVRTKLPHFNCPAFHLIEMLVNRKGWKTYSDFMLVWIISKEGFPQNFSSSTLWQYTKSVQWMNGGIYLFLFSLRKWEQRILYKRESEEKNLQITERIYRSWGSGNWFSKTNSYQLSS